MKKNVFLLFFIIGNVVFSQNDTLKYHFDKAQLSLENSALTRKKGVKLKFSNSIDASYELIIDNSINLAFFIDKSIDKTIPFSFQGFINSEKQLNQLLFNDTNIKISSEKKITQIPHTETTFNRDTISNELVVRIKHFKNNKRKKILNEFQYVFIQNDPTIEDNTLTSIKNRLAKSNPSILFDKKDNLKKIIYINENQSKIITEITNCYSTNFTLHIAPKNLITIDYE
ncbi:hypothetical protein Q361_108119 [Flavobacterium croceum DSM 17960]|uniref:Uncharacterized protein n=1 Tax=Flavobacterium croceum DSM 17960 TaxID=1121886 RepID=A0A2S4N7Z7_9FLAO|nr:hypothetical protein [Flavobacterium croceum]POS01791.1 hypothetical protein Q361_108119 [Flavobacterium croceum DSM 17960]